MTDNEETQKPVQISVTHTRTGVNMGDHAQDVVRMLAVDPEDTIQSIVDRTLNKPDWRGKPDPQFGDFIIIRVVEPKPTVPAPDDSL